MARLTQSVYRLTHRLPSSHPSAWSAGRGELTKTIAVCQMDIWEWTALPKIHFYVLDNMIEHHVIHVIRTWGGVAIWDRGAYLLKWTGNNRTFRTGVSSYYLTISNTSLSPSGRCTLKMTWWCSEQHGGASSNRPPMRRFCLESNI